MRTKHLCVLIHIWTKGEVGAPWNRFKPYSKILFTDRSKAVLLLWIIYVISDLFLLCFHARLFVDALWSPAGKGLTSWLLFVMSNCDVVTFPLVAWVRCGAWLYRFLIFALFLTLWKIAICLSIWVVKLLMRLFITHPITDLAITVMLSLPIFLPWNFTKELYISKWPWNNSIVKLSF